MTSTSEYEHSLSAPLNSSIDNVADENFWSDASSGVSKSCDQIDRGEIHNVLRCSSSRSRGSGDAEISQLSSIMKYSDPSLKIPEEDPLPTYALITRGEAFEDPSDDHISSPGLHTIGKREQKVDTSSYQDYDQFRIPAVVTPTSHVVREDEDKIKREKIENTKISSAKEDDFLQPSLPQQVSSGPGSLQQQLSWRMDPDQSLSDWKLEIFNRTTKTFSTYHVHRVVLAVGPRACGHFRKAFAHSIVGNRPGDRLTRLPLISQACSLIPDFLDYLYGNPSFQIRTETAVGLAYLSLYLQQSKLLEETMDFVMHDLKIETMHQYLVDAFYYDQHELAEWIIEMGAKEFPKMDVHSPATSSFLTNLSPNHLSQLLELLPPEQRSSPNLSVLLVEYLVYHKHEVTVDLLGEWAGQLSMLTSRAALALLDLEWALSQNENCSLSTELSPLQQRCLEVLSLDWESLCKIESSSLNRFVEHIMMSAAEAGENSELRKNLIEWFPNTLFEANEKLQKCQKALASSRLQEAALKDDLEHAVGKLNEELRETNNLRKTLESTKSELKDQLSGWMRKRSNDLIEFQSTQEHWDQERAVWKLERKKWLDERSELEREVHHLRSELARAQLRDSYDASVASSTQRETWPHVERASLFSYISAGVQASNSWSSEKDESL